MCCWRACLAGYPSAAYERARTGFPDVSIGLSGHHDGAMVRAGAAIFIVDQFGEVRAKTYCVQSSLIIGNPASAAEEASPRGENISRRVGLRWASNRGRPASLRSFCDTSSARRNRSFFSQRLPSLAPDHQLLSSSTYRQSALEPSTEFSSTLPSSASTPNSWITAADLMSNE